MYVLFFILWFYIVLISSHSKYKIEMHRKKKKIDKIFKAENFISVNKFYFGAKPLSIDQWPEINSTLFTAVNGIENREREIAGRGKRQKSAAFLERRDDVTYAHSPRPYNHERAVCQPRSYKPETVCWFFERGP